MSTSNQDSVPASTTSDSSSGQNTESTSTNGVNGVNTNNNQGQTRDSRDQNTTSLRELLGERPPSSEEERIWDSAPASRTQ
jgi:hypothetical protein